MDFKFEPTLYAQNLAEYAALEETEFLPTESKEEILDKLKGISRKKQDIAKVQNAIIDEYIARFEDGRSVLDEDAAEKLYVFLNSLINSQNITLDAPISLRLSRLLYSFYHGKDDLDRLASVLCYGLTSELIMSLEVEIHDYFSFPPLCEEYLSDIERFSPESQIKLLRAYSYRFVIKDSDGTHIDPNLFKIVEKRLYDCLEVVEENNTLKELYFQTLNNMITMINNELCVYNNISKNRDVFYHKFDLEESRDFLEMCIRKLSDHIENDQIPPMKKSGYQINAKIMSYHLGIITFDELITWLGGGYEKDLDDGFGGNLNMLVCSGFYFNYLYSFSPYSKEETEKTAREKIEKLLPRVLEIKKMGIFQFGSLILQFINSTSLFTGFYEFYDIVLAFTVFSDKALYVHTVMVKEISRMLLGHIIDEAPELVDGVCGRNKDYICSHREEMLALMEKCAMCHDIGKHFLIDIVSNSSRKLTDDEYSILRYHPENFSIVYENEQMEETEELKCIRDCALLHHRWHNGKGGYPEIPITNNMPFADIIAIADSLDAATDYIGRPYGAGKTLDELISEFLEMGGTRYSREVAEILAKPSVRAEVERIITERREEVNYKIYAFNEIES